MSNVEKMPFETYLAVINNSVGSKMFSQGFAKIDGKPTDIMRGGELSCAFFVSSVLTTFGFIKSMHATVTSTVKDLEASGWTKVDTPKIGDVIVWASIAFPNGEQHEHIGFAVAEDQAVSNDYASGTPQRHSFEQTPDGTARAIDAVYRGQHLFESPN